MAGNVREWCSTKFPGDFRDYDPKSHDALEVKSDRIPRGGAFDSYYFDL